MKEEVDNNGHRSVRTVRMAQAVAAKVAVAGLRKLSAELCPRCGLLAFKGLDDDVIGIPVTVDPLALSAVGEVVALRDGRTTYTLENNRLYVRHWWRMVRFRHREFDVYADHRCHSPMPPECAQTEKAPTKARKAISDEPEF